MFRLAAAIVLATGLLVAQESEIITLEQAVQISLARHPDVTKAEAASAVFQGRVREVRA